MSFVMSKSTKKIALKAVILSLTLVFLQACSTAPIDTAYRQSELHPALKIPAGLDPPQSNPRLMIPKDANIDESGRVAGIDELDVDFELPPQLKLVEGAESIEDLVPAQRSQPVRSKSKKHSGSH